MIIRILLIILSFISFSICYSQDIRGEWYGWGNINYLYDESNYLIAIDIEEKDEQINGYMTMYYMDKKTKFPIVGVFDKRTRTLLISEILIPMHFHDLKPLEKMDIDMYLHSKLINTRTGAQIKGNLISKTYKYLNNINFVLVKPYEELVSKLAVTEPELTPPTKLEEKRKVLITNEITVSSDTINIDIYDGSIIDGDTISVFYNNEKLLDKVKITEKPINIKLILDKREVTHLFVLQAENLGSIPPNTGVMIVYDNLTRREVYFSNSMQVSTGVIFTKGAR